MECFHQSPKYQQQYRGVTFYHATISQFSKNVSAERLRVESQKFCFFLTKIPPEQRSYTTYNISEPHHNRFSRKKLQALKVGNKSTKSIRFYQNLKEILDFLFTQSYQKIFGRVQVNNISTTPKSGFYTTLTLNIIFSCFDFFLEKVCGKKF